MGRLKDYYYFDLDVRAAMEPYFAGHATFEVAAERAIHALVMSKSRIYAAFTRHAEQCPTLRADLAAAVRAAASARTVSGAALAAEVAGAGYEGGSK